MEEAGRISERTERKTSGEKGAKRRGERTQNEKIKEEERRSTDDDNGSGQGAVERGKGGKRERYSVVRV